MDPAPTAGPRAVSLADDGSQMTFAWWTMDSNFISIGEFNGNPGGSYQRAAGLLNVGSHVIDSSRGLIYAQIPVTGATSTTLGTPMLQVLDADNLTLHDILHLPENLAGKSVLTSDHNTVYGVSDSGVLVLPVGNMNSVSASDGLGRRPGVSRELLQPQHRSPNPDDHRSGRRQYSLQYLFEHRLASAFRPPVA